ncbi:hypothetical protein F5Y03DRAFT_377422 [Xylaria venustula]|nr:hypothetical protein F5Y03DRAFT_377422 [Xylaria venustula]
MENNNVYLGVWTNYSKGVIFGATFTTTQQRGALLIAFTGFLIPFVASRFWKLLCIVLHLTHSTSKPRNAVHHQRQVILRNSSSADSGLVSLAQVIWAWRHSENKKDLYSVTLPMVFYSMACILIFSAAGGFSSQISVSAGNEVLLRGDNCGIPFTDSYADTSFLSYFANTINDAANYAQQCYNANVSGSLGCDKFIIQDITTTSTEYNASCPFQGNICRGINTSLHLDTGYIDSNSHLGLNLPSDQSFAYRYALTCSPLATHGHTTKWSTGNSSSTRYNYGGTVTTDGSVSDFIFESADLNIQYYDNNLTGIIASKNYLLAAVMSLTEQGTALSAPGYFIPSSSISRQDGDVSLIFLSGNGVYFFGQPMDDEWYRATAPTVPIYSPNHVNAENSAYMATEAASPLGCVEQYQWCNTAYPTGSGCGPLASFIDAAYGAAPFFNLSQEDLSNNRPSSGLASGARLIWPFLITSYSDVSIAKVVAGLGAACLASQSTLSSGVQLPLPLNQWQIDVTKWWNISLAVLQSSFVGTALGTAPDRLPPLNEQEKKLCHSQKILSNAYSSFNLFALLFTYITSGLIIVVSFIVEPILSFLSRRRNYKRYEALEWTVNESMQLYRLAQEQTGRESWSGGANSVPVTSSDNMLAHLDISNPKHPVFCRDQLEAQSVAEPKSDHGQASSTEHSDTLLAGGDEAASDGGMMSSFSHTDLDDGHHNRPDPNDTPQSTPATDSTSRHDLYHYVSAQATSAHRESYCNKSHEDYTARGRASQQTDILNEAAQDTITPNRHELHGGVHTLRCIHQNPE